MSLDPRIQRKGVTLERQAQASSNRSLLLSIATDAGTFAITIILVLVFWTVLLQVSGISPYIAKSPLDVFDFLVTNEKAEANRAIIGANLAITLSDTVIGFAAGLVASLVAAIVFQLQKGIAHALLPVAMLLASVPLIAMAPVIILITGRTAVAVAVIGGIVVLFPSLVSIAFGLRSVSPQIVDVVSTYGGSPWMAIRKAAIPSAVPSLFAAIRISVPGAITGALLAEWLATGSGIGSAVQTAIPQAQFTALWANVVVITLVSLALYSLVRVVERFVLRAMGMQGRS